MEPTIQEPANESSVNNPPSPDVQNPPNAPKIMNAKYKDLLLLLGVIVIGVILIVAAKIFADKTTPKQTPTTIMEAPTRPPSTPTPTPSLNSAEVKNYKTRLFDVSDKFFKDEGYPAELTSVPETQLTPISCTKFYTGYGKDYESYDDKTNIHTPLTDTTLLSYIGLLNKKYEGKTVDNIMACNSQTNQTVIFYGLGPCGGGCDGVPYVSIVKDSTVQEISKVPNDAGLPYYSCWKGLQLSNGIYFYFECSGGDVGGGNEIFQLNLNNSTLSTIRQCVEEPDATAQHSHSTCK